MISWFFKVCFSRMQLVPRYGEEEKGYQEHRNAALHARNRQLYNQIQDLKAGLSQAQSSYNP
jgi:cell division protein FtsB